jgi:hypothetical protein
MIRSDVGTKDLHQQPITLNQVSNHCISFIKDLLKLPITKHLITNMTTWETLEKIGFLENKSKSNPIIHKVGHEYPTPNPPTLQSEVHSTLNNVHSILDLDVLHSFLNKVHSVLHLELLHTFLSKVHPLLQLEVLHSFLSSIPRQLHWWSPMTCCTGHRV